MNENTLGLILFATIALCAVFAFLIVLGPVNAVTGKISNDQKFPVSNYYGQTEPVSTYQWQDGYTACNRINNCNNRAPSEPIAYDPEMQIYTCMCKPTFNTKEGEMYYMGPWMQHQRLS